MSVLIVIARISNKPKTQTMLLGIFQKIVQSVTALKMETGELNL